MKSLKFIKIFSLFFAFCLFILLTGCSDSLDKSYFGLKLNDEGRIDGDKIYINVCADISSYSFINSFDVPSKYRWELHKNKECMPESNIVSKTTNLYGNPIVFYALFINNEDANDIHLYTIEVVKKCDYDYNNGVVVRNQTCSESGQIKYLCKRNNNHFEYETIPATGHTSDEGTITKVSTCKENGKKTYTCTVCGEVIKTEVLDKTTNHNYIDAVTKEATCTIAGKKTYACTICDKSYSEEIPATGHGYEDVVTAPTCAADGYTTYTCVICGYSCIENIVPATGSHIEGRPNNKNATCEHPGFSNKTYCVDCGVLVNEGEYIPPLGHQEEIITGITPTCTNEGLTEGKKCYVCNKVLVSQKIISKTEHIFVDYICSGCNLHYFTEGLVFELNLNNSYIVKGYTGSSNDIVIPSEYNGKKVISIGEEAFKNCSFLTSILIPDSVTSIGDGAFYGCDSLTNITIPDSVTFIGFSAFENCSKLISIIIPDSVSAIEDYTFNYCGMLSDVVIGEGVKSIGSYSFGSCYSLKSITVPDNVISIGDGTFYNCSSLSNIVIGKSVNSIGSSVFEGCISLESLSVSFEKWNINSNFGYIFGAKSSSETAKYVPTSLKEVIITSGTIIREDTFEGCSSLTSIVISDSVTSIGDGAFYKCSSLSNVVIGKGVKSIGISAFEECSSLENIIIPNNVTTINEYCFFNCGSLTTVIFEEGSQLTNIGEYAFYDCSSLKNIKIPNSVISIGVRAFMGCGSISVIVIPNPDTSIGSQAFRDCSSLTIFCALSSVKPYADWNFSKRPLYLAGEWEYDVDGNPIPLSS